MIECQLGRVEKHPAKSKVFEKCVVLTNVAVSRITDYGTIYVVHVTAKLMSATGFGKEFHMRIASRFVSARWKGALNSRERFEKSERFLRVVAFSFGSVF